MGRVAIARMWGDGVQIFGNLLRPARLGRAVAVVVGGLVAAVALAPVSASSWGGGSTGCGNSGCTTPFAVPLPIPQTLSPTSQDATTDYYTVTEKPANLSVIPGKTTPMWTYNGTAGEDILNRAEAPPQVRRRGPRCS